MFSEAWREAITQVQKYHFWLQLLMASIIEKECKWALFKNLASLFYTFPLIIKIEKCTRTLVELRKCKIFIFLVKDVAEWCN